MSDAINAAASKAQRCQTKQREVEADLRNGFRALDESQRRAFFEQAMGELLRSDAISSGRATGLTVTISTIPQWLLNYQTADAQTPGRMNTEARVTRIGQNVYQKCMAR